MEVGIAILEFQIYIFFVRESRFSKFLDRYYSIMILFIFLNKLFSFYQKNAPCKG